MNSPKTILENMRRSRVERLLSSPPSGWLVSKGFRRFLCVIAVVFSYLYLFTLLVPAVNISMYVYGNGTEPINLDELDSYKSFLLSLSQIIGWVSVISPLILISSFLILRTSMRRVTSLPDEYLDELEIANRDWAFKTGYLVIRRIGLSVAAAFFILKILAYNPSINLDDDGNRIREGLEASLYAVESYLASLTAYGSFNFYFTVIALMTYVAYTFPLILLAWRESKFPEVVPVLKKVVPLGATRLVARKYFRRASLVGTLFIGWALIQVLGLYLALQFSFPYISNFLTYSGVLFFYLFIVVPYAMFVYIWASIKTVEILKAARQNNYNQGKNAGAAIGALIFFVITQLLGISIPILFSQIGRFSGGDNPILIIFGLGLAMIPTQILSFVFIRRLGKEEELAD